MVQPWVTRSIRTRTARNRTPRAQETRAGSEWPATGISDSPVWAKDHACPTYRQATRAPDDAERRLMQCYMHGYLIRSRTPSLSSLVAVRYMTHLSHPRPRRQLEKREKPCESGVSHSAPIGPIPLPTGPPLSTKSAHPPRRVGNQSRVMKADEAGHARTHAQHPLVCAPRACEARFHPPGSGLFSSHRKSAVSSHTRGFLYRSPSRVVLAASPPSASRQGW